MCVITKIFPEYNTCLKVAIAYVLISTYFSPSFYSIREKMVCITESFVLQGFVVFRNYPSFI